MALLQLCSSSLHPVWLWSTFLQSSPHVPPSHLTSFHSTDSSLHSVLAFAVSLEQLQRDRETLESESSMYSSEIEKLQHKLQIMSEMYQEKELKLHRWTARFGHVPGWFNQHSSLPHTPYVYISLYKLPINYTYYTTAVLFFNYSNYQSPSRPVWLLMS